MNALENLISSITAPISSGAFLIDESPMATNGQLAATWLATASNEDVDEVVEETGEAAGRDLWINRAARAEQSRRMSA